MEEDKSTEEKIKSAAKKKFQQKGFAATKTRDIAEEAGINLALLNYYFRSKEKLFNIIMEEALREVFLNVVVIVENTETNLEEKIIQLTRHYTNTLMQNPNLPLFVFGELQKNPELFFQNKGMSRGILSNSSLYKQLKEELENNGKQNVNPLNIMINILAINIFPFVVKVPFAIATDLNKDDIKALIEQRQELTPGWIMGMIN